MSRRARRAKPRTDFMRAHDLYLCSRLFALQEKNEAVRCLIPYGRTLMSGQGRVRCVRDASLERVSGG